MKGLSGTYPQQPVAVYIDFSQGYGNTSGGSLNNVQNEIGNLWLNYQSGFTVVTSQEVNNGAVSLSSFKAVLPLNGTDANLTDYQNAGGTLLTEPEQLTQYSTAYATIDAPDVGNLQVVPAVATSGTSAALTLANITSGTTYDAPVSVSPAGLDLASGSYYLVNAATGAAVPQTIQSNGVICATADLGVATLGEWNVVAGTPPSGTASSSCPVTETGATSVSATAGQPGQGLNFLEVGSTSSGSDGNLTQITQDGETADETWTTSQSGSGDANVYLQLDPMSAVEAASDVTVQVTYWATSGQGFVVQYDTPSNAYENGPTVSSPGTGTWTTASVQLTGAQFEEAQNDSADLRLNVTDASVPLIVASITMSVTGSTNAEGPYGGTPAAVPGTVEAANYDTGGQGVAYNVTSVNGTANSYRSDGVDLEVCSDTGCGYDLGWTTAGQWFKYTVDVATAGTYTVSFRLASPDGVTDALHIANSAGTNLSGAVNAPDTGGWQDWATVTASVTLPAGTQTLTVDQDNSGWNIYYLDFAAASSSTTNLALGEPVTASSYYENYVPSNVTDGNTSTYWESTDGAGYPQTITVNLGSVQSIGSITLDLPPATDWTTRTETLSVLGSTNGSTFSQIVASAGYTFNPATGNTVTITLPSGTSTQYVQLSFTANTGWDAAQLSEFQIYS